MKPSNSSFFRSDALWHPLLFLFCHLLAALVYASWLYQPTRAYWDILDNQTFYLLNGSLTLGPDWQLFWAWANSRAGDIGAGILMLIFYFFFMLADNRRYLVERLTVLGIMAGMILLSQDGGLVNRFEELTAQSRFSPSIVLEPVYRLSELVPHIKAKDASPSSFPGDHGVIILIWVACFLLYANWRWNLGAILLGALILLPRLVSGGHWITDNLVGSSTLVLLMVAWLLCTPIGYYAMKLGFAILGAVLPERWQQRSH